MAEEQSIDNMNEAVAEPIDIDIDVQEEPVETPNEESTDDNKDDTYAKESELASENPEKDKSESKTDKKKRKKKAKAKKKPRKKFNLLQRFTPLELTVLTIGLILALIFIAIFYYLYDSARKSNKAIPQNGIVASDTDKSWETFVISGNKPAAKEFAVATSTVNGTNGVQVDYRITKQTVKLLEDLKKHAENSDENVNILAGYTSVEDYLNNYNTLVQQYKDQGYSTANANAAAQQRMMIPGTDEHSTGLLVNFGLDETINPASFKESESYKWLTENAYKYGFVLRYPEGKEEITLHPYDPSAFRYVGEDAAKIINSAGWSLEEYNADVAAQEAALQQAQQEQAAQQQAQQQQNQQAQ